VTDEKLVILVVEDDLDVAEMLDAYFQVQGYEVHSANCGEDAIQISQSIAPDIVILDIRLPDMDGFEVAHLLRHNRRTKDVPIIFLTEKRSRIDRLQGLELGADDYLTKPFDVQELRLRVRNALRRSTQGTLTNPVTNLPEGVLVDERLFECLNDENWAILYIALENLDVFRETYGFVAADDVLRAVNLMIRSAIREYGGASDFVGHIGSDEFIVVTIPVRLINLSERITTRLEQSLDYFYPLKDRDRQEVKKKHLSIRMGQLSASHGPFTDVEAIKIKLLQQSK
jgi:PleD family two-component response regulator